MPFYHYRQNNSGGEWDINTEAGISINAIIEAGDAEAANYRAELIGLYFDGVRNDRDCECCGDRWERAGDWYNPGSDAPTVWGDLINPGDPLPERTTREFDGPHVFIHYADGSIKTAWV